MGGNTFIIRLSSNFLSLLKVVIEVAQFINERKLEKTFRDWTHPCKQKIYVSMNWVNISVVLRLKMEWTQSNKVLYYIVQIYTNINQFYLLYLKSRYAMIQVDMILMDCDWSSIWHVIAQCFIPTTWRRHAFPACNKKETAIIYFHWIHG